MKCVPPAGSDKRLSAAAKGIKSDAADHRESLENYGFCAVSGSMRCRSRCDATATRQLRDAYATLRACHATPLRLPRATHATPVRLPRGAYAPTTLPISGAGQSHGRFDDAKEQPAAPTAQGKQTKSYIASSP
jgi:hypothetical protein